MSIIKKQTVLSNFGLSLIELLIVMSIFSIMTLGSAEVYKIAFESDREAKLAPEALSFQRELLASFRRNESTGFDDCLMFKKISFSSLNPYAEPQINLYSNGIWYGSDAGSFRPPGSITDAVINNTYADAIEIKSMQLKNVVSISDERSKAEIEVNYKLMKSKRLVGTKNFFIPVLLKITTDYKGDSVISCASDLNEDNDHVCAELGSTEARKNKSNINVQVGTVSTGRIQYECSAGAEEYVLSQGSGSSTYCWWDDGNNALHGDPYDRSKPIDVRENIYEARKVNNEEICQAKPEESCHYMGGSLNNVNDCDFCAINGGQWVDGQCSIIAGAPQPPDNPPPLPNKVWTVVGEKFFLNFNDPIESCFLQIGQGCSVSDEVKSCQRSRNFITEIQCLNRVGS